MGTHPRLVNLSAAGRGFRERCAILAECDLLVAPDSAILHAAVALGVPALWLFGPFSSSLRLTAPCQQAIDAGGLCAPCFHHSRASSIFPQGNPCSREGRCHVLGTIPLAKVFAEVMKREGSTTEVRRSTAG